MGLSGCNPIINLGRSVHSKLICQNRCFFNTNYSLYQHKQSGVGKIKREVIYIGGRIWNYEIEPMCWGGPRGQELSQQRTELCRGSCIYSLGMARVCVVGRGKRQQRALWAILRRAWVLSSRHQRVNEEIPKYKWQDQSSFSKDWSGSSVAKREKALLQCLKTIVPVLLVATKRFLKLGTSTECPSGITMPGICTDPFTSKALSVHLTTICGGGPSRIIPIHRWGSISKLTTEVPKYFQLEQKHSSSVLFKAEI